MTQTITINNIEIAGKTYGIQFFGPKVIWVNKIVSNFTATPYKKWFDIDVETILTNKDEAIEILRYEAGVDKKEVEAFYTAILNYVNKN